MNIAILKTGLFPDTKTLDEGLEHASPSYNVSVYDVTSDNLADSDWDQVVEKILDAERIIVL
ncbi:MAG: hypothetical protein QM484_04970 [Woeseiaceae bacterium]